MTHPPSLLTPGITVFERGWLSANNILLQPTPGHDGPSALVDSGYCSHAQQTLALLEQALDGQPLELLINTHLHSDHCGGNAALQARYPQLQTAIPPGQAGFVHDWDPQALSYTPTGQQCPRFHADQLLTPGQDIQLGTLRWQVHAAPGHDPHAVVLFEPRQRLLLSADALWQHGFGVVFPELEGERAFDQVAATLDLIEALAPRTIVPGHGSLFTDVQAALARARKRLDGFVQDPLKHAHYGAKVLLKFKLLEQQRLPQTELLAWAAQTPYFVQLHASCFASAGTLAQWAASLVQDLVRSGAAQQQDGWVLNIEQTRP